MRLITADEVIAMTPCSRYDEEGIRERHGEEGLTPRELAELEVEWPRSGRVAPLPPLDAFWVMLRLIEDEQHMRDLRRRSSVRLAAVASAVADRRIAKECGPEPDARLVRLAAALGATASGTCSAEELADAEKNVATAHQLPNDSNSLAFGLSKGSSHYWVHEMRDAARFAVPPRTECLSTYDNFCAAAQLWINGETLVGLRDLPGCLRDTDSEGGDAEVRDLLEDAIAYVEEARA